MRGIDLAMTCRVSSDHSLLENGAGRVTLMDLKLPGMSGLETIRRIRSLRPSARIVVLTMKVHVKHLLGKLAVRDRAAAVTHALQRGIIHLDD